MTDTLEVDFDEAPTSPGRPLRYYQKRWFANFQSCRATHKRLLLDAATGTGKSRFMAECAHHEWTALNGRTLVLENRDKLVRQTAAGIERDTGLTVDIEMAKHHASPFAPIVVASVQTLCRDMRLTGFADDHFSLVIADESHHSLANSWAKVLRYFHFGAESLVEGWQMPEPHVAYAAKSTVLGVTATPDISGKRNLGEFYQHICDRYQLIEAVNDGYLVRPITKNIPLKIDIRGLRPGRTPNGSDFKPNELSERLVPVLEALAGQIAELARDRKSIAFVPSIECARILAAAVTRAGMKGIFVSGECLDVDEKTEDFVQSGPGTVLCNAALYVEGADFPDISCVICARATKSRGFYCLDMETEVLTATGWKRSISPGEPVATFDRSTGAIDYLPAISWIRRQLYDGERFASISGPSCDIRVTEDHRMVYDNKRRTGWKFTTAKRLSELRDTSLIPVSGVWSGATGVPLSDDELRFIGWVMTDGSINPKNRQITITQGCHQPWIEEIQKCIDGCGLKATRSVRVRRSQFISNSPQAMWTISYGKPRGTGKHLSGWGRLEKWLSKDFSEPLMLLSEKQFDVLIHAIHLGDGSKQAGQCWTRRSYHITTKNLTFAERLQIVAVRSGYRCAIKRQPNRDSYVYIIHLKKQTFIRVGGRQPDRPNWKLSDHRPNEECWCVETPRGTIITRRNGKVAIMGNCQQVGRGTRILPGVVDGLETPEERKAAIAASAKPDLLILDPLWISDRLDLCDAYDLFTDKPEVKARMKEMGDVPDLQEAAREAERDFIKALEKEARKHARKAARTVDPLALSVSLGDVAHYVPETIQDARPPTAGQLDFIRKQGLSTDGIKYLGQASKLIGRLMNRYKAGLATIGQLDFLRTLGYGEDATTTLTQREASALIDRTLAQKKASRSA